MEEIERQDEITEMVRTQRQKLDRARGCAVAGFCVIAVAVELAGYMFPDVKEIGKGLYAIAAICFMFLIASGKPLEFIYWRCPKCGKPLGRKLNLKYCSNCGVQLQ